MPTQEETPRCSLTLTGAASGGWRVYACSACGHECREQQGDRPICPRGLGGPPLPTEGVEAGGRTAQPDTQIPGSESEILIFTREPTQEDEDYVQDLIARGAVVAKLPDERLQVRFAPEGSDDFHVLGTHVDMGSSDLQARPSESPGLSFDALVDAPEPESPALSKAEEGYVRGVIEDLSTDDQARRASAAAELTPGQRGAIDRLVKKNLDRASAAAEENEAVEVGTLAARVLDTRDAMEEDALREHVPLGTSAAELEPESASARPPDLPRTFRLGALCECSECECRPHDGARVVGVCQPPLHLECDCFLVIDPARAASEETAAALVPQEPAPPKPLFRALVLGEFGMVEVPVDVAMKVGPDRGAMLAPKEPVADKPLPIFRLGHLCRDGSWSPGVCNCRDLDGAEVVGGYPPIHESCDCVVVAQEDPVVDKSLPTFSIGHRCGTFGTTWDFCNCARLDGAKVGVVGCYPPVHEGCDCTVEAASKVPLDFVAAARKRGRDVPTAPNQILANALGQALSMESVLVVARFKDGRIHTTLPDDPEEAAILARVACLEADQRLIDEVMTEPQPEENDRE